jgi:hypothetical protein
LGEVPEMWLIRVFRPMRMKTQKPVATTEATMTQTKVRMRRYGSKG